jgi:signal transduction histidine kinase
MKGWFIFILLFSATKTYSQVLLSDKDIYSLDGNILMLKETDKQLSINDCWQQYNSNQFKPVHSVNNAVNIGFVENVYWFAIPVKNISNQQLALEAALDNGGIFEIGFYLLSGTDGKIVKRFITGTHYDYFTRPILNRHFYFPVNLQSDSSAIIFYRIDMRGNALYIPFLLMKKNYTQSNENSIAGFYAFFCGWLVFVALFSMIAFFWSSKRLYLFYSLYVTSCCFAFLGDGNFDYKWLYPHSPWLATISPSVYALLVCIFMLLFTINILQLKTARHKLFLFVAGWIVLLLIALLLLPSAYIFSDNIPFRKFVFRYSFTVYICAAFLQAYVILLRVKDKFKTAYLYGIALTGVLVSFAIYLLHVLNLIPDLLPAYIYLPIGFAFEIIVLSVALLYNYNFYKKQHHQLSIDIANQQIHFSQQLLQAQEAEQQRIAEDLHDELGGNLAAIKMKLQSMDTKSEDMDSIIQLINNASKNARNIAHNLMPPEFENTKLETLLQNYYNRLNREGNIHFNFIVSGKDGHFDKQQSLIIYRILLELTSNIIKHAAATKATIQLVNYIDSLEILAEDNGKGFATTEGDGIGLKNIRSRVGFLKGDINIDNAPTGTTIMIRIPYTQ